MGRRQRPVRGIISNELGINRLELSKSRVLEPDAKRLQKTPATTSALFLA